MKNSISNTNVQDNQDFFVNAATVLSIAPAANVSANIAIEADASFFATKISMFATIAGAAVTQSSIVIPLVTLQITDNGSGRNLFNQAIPLGCIAGGGDLPYMIPIKRLFRANSSILLNFTNFSASTTYRIDIALSGVKIWG